MSIQATSNYFVRHALSPAESAEEKALVDCYKRIGNPHLAAEVIALLESDPDRKRSHPAGIVNLRSRHARKADGR